MKRKNKAIDTSADGVSIVNRTINGFFWVSSAAGIEAVLKIIVLAVMARLITKEEFGLAGAALLVIGFSKLFTQLGVGPAIVQRKNLEEVHISTGFNISILMGIFFAIVLFFSAYQISGFFKMDELTIILKVLAFVFIIESLSLVSQALIQRNMRFKAMSAISVVSFISGYGIVGVIMAFLNFGVWAIIGAHITQTIIKTILFMVSQKHVKSYRINAIAFKELMYFGGGFTIARFWNYFAGQGDNIVVGRWLGAAALGVYGRAYQFMVMPVNLIGTALDKVLFPIISKIQDDKRKVEEAYIKGVYSVAILSIPLSAFVFILAPEIVDFVLGDNWSEVIIPFQILALGLYFRISYRISDSLSRAMGVVYKRAWIQFIYAAFVIAGSWIGQHWGLKGVAVAILIAIFMNFILLARLSIKTMNGSWYKFLEAHLNGFVLALIVFAFVYGIVFFLRLWLVAPILILVVVSFTLPVILFLLYYFIPNQIFGPTGIWLVDKLINNFKKK
jgi:PST family polysaccharide transporter